MQVSDQRFIDLMNDVVRDDYAITPHERLDFRFDEYWFGDQMWVAVIFEGSPLVGPFHVPHGQPSHLPYFAEEFGRYV